MKEFISLIEVIKPSRFINSNMHWSELGRQMASRENILRAFFLKSIYNFATTKMLIESLRTNLTLSRLCGWEYASCVLSKATFSRVFKAFSAEKIRYRERTTVDRTNSDLKDNYGGNNIRVKGPLKVFCHLMFRLIAIAIK